MTPAQPPRVARSPVGGLLLKVILIQMLMRANGVDDVELQF